MSDLSMYDQATPNASRTSDHKIIQQSTKGTPVPTSHPKRFNKSTCCHFVLSYTFTFVCNNIVD